jgi:hypothetical protein
MVAREGGLVFGGWNMEILVFIIMGRNRACEVVCGICLNLMGRQERFSMGGCVLM